MSPFRDRAAVARRRIGRYELLRRLAIGGMGEIFLARERGVAGVDRLVVLKLMLDELAEQPEHVALFIDEARISAQLAHPNIVQVYEFSKDDGAYFMSMEYVPGQNLARVCQRAAQQRVTYPRHSAIHVVAEMARGLDFAHKATDSHGNPMGIVHRDISPHNVLISTEGDVKLLDFGIAHASVRQQRTQTGVLRGKFGYMSPEQVEQAALDARSDVFCAGIVLWETTLMKRLFRGETELDTIRLVVSGHVPSPRSVDASYPDDLEAVVMTALATDPNERFQSAGAMAAALRNVLKDRPRVEKESLGALVTGLFPETLPNDLGKVVRITAPAAVAEPAIATETVSAAELVISSETVTVAASPKRIGVPTIDEPRPSRLLWVALAAGLAVAVVVALVTTRRVDSSSGVPHQSIDAGASIDAQFATNNANTVGAAIDGGEAGDGAVVVAQPSKPVPARRHRKRREGKRSRSRVDAGAGRVIPRPTIADAAPTASPPRVEYGRLAVTATPYGRVTINGNKAGATDLVQRLAVGTYRVAVTMSDGSGAHTATVRVESNKKTKCQATGKRLRCQSPR